MKIDMRGVSLLAQVQSEGRRSAASAFGARSALRRRARSAVAGRPVRFFTPFSAPRWRRVRPSDMDLGGGGRAPESPPSASHGRLRPSSDDARCRRDRRACAIRSVVLTLRAQCSAHDLDGALAALSRARAAARSPSSARAAACAFAGASGAVAQPAGHSRLARRNFAEPSRPHSSQWPAPARRSRRAGSHRASTPAALRRSEAGDGVGVGVGAAARVFAAPSPSRESAPRCDARSARTTTPRPAGPRRRSVEARHPRNRGRRGRTRRRWVVRAAPLCICAARASASTASSWDWTDQA